MVSVFSPAVAKALKAIYCKPDEIDRTSFRAKIDGEWITEEQVENTPLATKNENGHLLCQGPCGEPYPYAEAKNGRFVCSGCRSRL